MGKADLVGSCELPNGNDLCGGHGQGNCWCDDLCVGYGDCRSDVDSVCGIEEPEPEEPCVVSGCNSEICAPVPMFSPCVALPEFACFQDADCGHFAADGGWEQTEELTSCLDAASF